MHRNSISSVWYFLWHLISIDRKRVTKNSKIDFQIFKIRKIFLRILMESTQTHGLELKKLLPLAYPIIES